MFCEISNVCALKNTKIIKYDYYRKFMYVNITINKGIIKLLLTQNANDMFYLFTGILPVK